MQEVKAVAQDSIATAGISLHVIDGEGLNSLGDIVAGKVIERLLPLLNHPEEEDELMDVTELAAMIGKSNGQIYQWVHLASHGLGAFPFMKAGKSLRFSKKAVLEWMRRNSALESR